MTTTAAAGPTTRPGSLSSVKVEGEVGTDPEVTWDGEFEADEVTSEVITEGDGEEIESGDTVLADYWLGQRLHPGAGLQHPRRRRPQLLIVDDGTLSPVFLEATEGQTIGSRVAVAASAEEIFGPEGNPQLGVGNKDTVVAVVDLLSKVADGPEGAEKPAPAWAPKIVEEDGVPDRRSTSPARPSPRRSRHGDPHRGHRPGRREGPDHRRQLPRPGLRGQEAVRRELQQGPAGRVRDRHRRGRPRLGQDPGRREGRQPARDLAIPPADGYGEQGNQQAGIKGTDTLYFVVDILAAG